MIDIANSYDSAIARELFSAAEIAAAIERLATTIAQDHSRVPLTLVGVLKGALYVAADLARAISVVPDGPSDISVDYMCVSSYGNAARSSGEVRLLKDFSAILSAAAASSSSRTSSTTASRCSICERYWENATRRACAPASFSTSRITGWSRSRSSTWACRRLTNSS